MPPAVQRHVVLSSVALLAFSLVACATTSTKRISLDPAAVSAEEARQRRLVLSDAMSQQRRLTDIAYPLVRAATGLCPHHLALRSGMLVGNAWEYEGEWRDAAFEVGFGDGLQVVAVADGSPAGRAGLRPGDRLLEVDGQPIPHRDEAIAGFAELLGEVVDQGRTVFELTYARAGEVRALQVGLEEQCDYPVLVYSDPDPQALADGRRVFVSSGMMRFVDDHELAVIVSHEVAHNAMGHVEAKRKNAILGAVLGAIVDVAVGAESGYSTGGSYTMRGARIGSEAFSQDFENEADYVGMYALASAGIPLEDAPSLWRQMALADKESIGFARTHPTTAERFLRLAKAAEEIGYKKEAGLALRPDPEGADELDGLDEYAARDPEAGGDSPDAFATLREARPRPRPEERRWGDRYWGPTDRDRSPRPLTRPIGTDPVPLTEGWSRSLEWDGDDDLRTESFRTSGPWKLVWKSAARSSDEPLLIEVVVLPGETVVARVTQDGPSAEAAELLVPEPGLYFLEIHGIGGNWYVGIETPEGGLPDRP